MPSSSLGEARALPSNYGSYFIACNNAVEFTAAWKPKDIVQWRDVSPLSIFIHIQLVVTFSLSFPGSAHIPCHPVLWLGSFLLVLRIPLGICWRLNHWVIILYVHYPLEYTDSDHSVTFVGGHPVSSPQRQSSISSNTLHSLWGTCLIQNWGWFCLQSRARTIAERNSGGTPTRRCTKLMSPYYSRLTCSLLNVLPQRLKPHLLLGPRNKQPIVLPLL